MWTLISWALLLLLGLAAAFFLLYCAYIQHTHMKYDHIPGPPRDSFLMGHTPTMMKLAKNNELVYDYFLDCTEKYGPVVRINGFHKVFVIVSSPEAIKELLMTNKHPKDKFYDQVFKLFGVRFLGKGLLTERDYDHWHKQRRIMDPAFSRPYLMGLMGTFNEKAEELMEKLDEKADNKTEVKMHDLLNRMTLDVIAKVAFDLELNALHDDKTPFPRAILMAMRGLIELREPLGQFMPSKKKVIQEIRDSIRLLRKTGKECIEMRQKMVQDGVEVPTDILTQILKGGALEDDELLIDNFLTFFIAGQETTANQLAFVVQELARHPEILQKVQAEVDEVIGSRRYVETDDLPKLRYLSQVLKETLRLYPPVPGTPRLLEEDFTVEGVKIPKNTTVAVYSYITGRLEQFFKDPLTFDPDRFSRDAPKPYFTYFPFSLGSRSCIGQIFSQMEAKVVMAKLLQRFDFELVEDQTFKILDTGTLRPMEGARCRLRVRERQ
ncbi:cholesterol 24-hydroxylase-like isoform X1 [Bufo bufo]|uniref:cholesterol 24-hydroxylase-like isoform X1 n=1 Tax=Bufo bufo TaxID=8384 RepID=UPI001ABEB29C|nr:cholesterol 24-hydroxylase-like isoform X1 [Bufo bufo]XP_040268615.1 cholesterol 24-hydroxylase-like isoform X1 [Bufo bufo]